MERSSPAWLRSTPWERSLSRSKHDLGLRLVELKVGVGEDEQTTGKGFANKLFGERVQLRWLHRRGDHELNREVSATGQRRWRQWDDPDARDFRQRAD